MTSGAGLRATLEAGRGGTFRSTAGVRQITQVAEAAGWPVARLDTGELRDKADLMERIAIALSLPAWFGRNWDALEDALRDLDEPPGLVLIWTGSQTLDRRLRETLWEILQGRSDEADETPFVLVRTAEN